MGELPESEEDQGEEEDEEEQDEDETPGVSRMRRRINQMAARMGVEPEVVIRLAQVQIVKSRTSDAASEATDSAGQEGFAPGDPPTGQDASDAAASVITPAAAAPAPAEVSETPRRQQLPQEQRASPRPPDADRQQQQVRSGSPPQQQARRRSLEGAAAAATAPLSRQFVAVPDMWNPNAPGATRPGSGTPWDYQPGVYNLVQVMSYAMAFLSSCLLGGRRLSLRVVASVALQAG